MLQLQTSIEAAILLLVGVLTYFQPGVSAQDLFQCYRCQYTKLETDNSAVDWVLGMLSKLSDEHCKLEDEQDQYDVDLRTCPPAGDGKVNRCVNIRGEVSTNIEYGPLGLDFDIKYKAISRDCVSVDPSDSEFSMGCHDSLPSYSPVRDLVTSAFDKNDVGTVKFTGKTCYGGKLYDSTGAGSQGTGSAGLIALGCVLCVLRYLRW